VADPRHSRSKLRRLANEETARARRLASNPALRIVVLSDLPPIETDKSGGQWLADLRQAMADALEKQGHGKIKPEQINPFEAEPCAAAILIGTHDELREIQARLGDTRAMATTTAGDVRTVVDATEKIVERELPNLHGKCDGLAERMAELEDRIPAPDPLEGDGGVVELLRGQIAELERRLDELEGPAPKAAGGGS
jgi:hypothetical protein